MVIMIIRATRRLVFSGALIGIVSLSSGCGSQPARPGLADQGGSPWDFDQAIGGAGGNLTDSASHPVVSERDGASRFWLKGRSKGAGRDASDMWARIRAGFSLPSPDHPAIDAEVDWFVRNQGFLDRTTQRARPYLHHIVEQVEARGMPSEIALLPAVESAFQPFAYSPARASGIWQFIPETGRRFGLRQTWWYDGRRDVVASTRAALDYLAVLQEHFQGDWLLAIAAYNCGEGTVLRAVQEKQRRGETADFWNVSLPEETRAYVPRLLALARVVSSPSSYGLTLASIPNEPYMTSVHIDGPIDLDVAAEIAQMPVSDIRHLNPGFSRWATDPEGPHHLVLPLAKADGFRERLEALPKHERVPWRQHVVRRGETVASLASRYGTTPDTLRQVNQLSGQRLASGAVLRVPVSARAAGESVVVAQAETDAAPARAGDRPTSSSARTARKSSSSPIATAPVPAERTLSHTVKRGETLLAVARKFDVSGADLARWNGLSPDHRVKVGQKLSVRAPAESAAVVVVQTAQAAPNTRPERATASTTAKTAAPVATPARTAQAAKPRSQPVGTERTKARASPPVPIRYKVKAGESLWAISQRFGVSVAALRRWNNMAEKESLQPGQEINVHREDARIARAG